MNKIIKVDQTPKLIREALLSNGVMDIIFISVIVLIALLQGYAVWDYYGFFDGSWLVYLLVYSLLPVVSVLIYGYAYFKGISMIKSMKTPVVKYRFTDKWLYVNSDISTSKNAWALFSELRKGSKAWQITVPSNGTLVLPVEVLDEKLKKFLSVKIPKSHRNLGWYSKNAFFLFITSYLAYSFYEWLVQLGNG